jgi:hypothetical protein
VKVLGFTSWMKSAADSSHDDESVFAITTDVVKGFALCPVRTPAPGHGSPLSVKGNFEDAFATLRPNVRVFSSIIVEPSHLPILPRKPLQPLPALAGAAPSFRHLLSRHSPDAALTVSSSGRSYRLPID